MIRRILTSLVGIPLLIYLCLFAGDAVFVAAVTLAMLLGLNEYYGLATAKGAEPISWLGYLMGVATLLAFHFRISSLFLAAPLMVAIVLTAMLFSRRDTKLAFESTAYTIFGPAYVAGLMGYLIAIRMLSNGVSRGTHLVMLLFVIIWADDIFAYLVGKKFGKHPLASKASPKKTVEGGIAGFVFSIVTAIVYSHFYLGDMPMIHAGILGALIGAVGQIGDLCESQLKRSADVKDSGAILPGHGGLLDRIDSLLFGAPALYYYCYYVLNFR